MPTTVPAPAPVQDPRAFLAARAGKRMPVVLDDGQLWVRMMEGTEVNEFRDYAMKDEVSDFQAMVRIVTLCLCGEDGAVVYKLEEEPVVAKLPFMDLNAIGEAATKFNRLDKASVEAAKGKSVGAGSAASPSA